MSIQVRSNEPEVKAPEAKATEDKPSESLGALTSAPEAKPSEQNEPTESDTLDKEETESEPEDSDPKETEPTDHKDEGEDKPKKKGGFQRRIDKLNARVSAREQEIEYWKQQALKSASEPRNDSKVEANKPVASEGKPTPDKFDTHAEYVEALTDWKTDQKLKEHDQKLEKSKVESEQAKVINSYAERVKAFAAKTADFDEVLEEVNDIPLSMAVREIILTSENGPELAYELAKNREEYARMCKLSPLAAAREIGRLESKLAIKSSDDKSPELKKITKAPKPLEPVNAGGKGSATKSIFDPNISQADYERLRMEQIKKRRQAG